jgi:hypothetical protein
VSGSSFINQSKTFRPARTESAIARKNAARFILLSIVAACRNIRKLFATAIWGCRPLFRKKFIKILCEKFIVKRGLKSLFKSFSIEFLIYGALVAGYFLLVLHFLEGWLNQLFHQDRKTYAAVALTLIVAQGVLLEGLTRLLVHIGGKNKAR